MRRPLLILGVMLLAGGAVFWGGQRLMAAWCVRHLANPTDDLDWLRLEFRLSDAELASVRRLHEGYLPRCRDFCERIDARKRELKTLLASPSTAAAPVAQKLIEIGTIRAECQAAMLQHFREVSQIMPPEQGRRYLTAMQDRTLGFHEQVERTMAPGAGNPHGHR